MRRHTHNNLTYLTFDLFTDCPIIHGVFLRHGGVSQGEFGSLNLGIVRGDTTANVQHNRQLALEALNLKQVCSLYQQHGKTIVSANPNIQYQADGLTTQQKNLALRIIHADCQAAIFYDPVKHALSNIHCGWRGNVQNIYLETIETMKKLYGSKPENLLVGISPSLGPAASEFVNHAEEMPEAFYPFQYRPTYFDLWQISRWQLEACGVLPHHIEIAEICTYSNPQDFFSYRRCNLSGRHATFAALQG